MTAADDATVVSDIVAALTPAQRDALAACTGKGLRSLRPYHNLHGDLTYKDADGHVRSFDGRDMDRLHRVGLVHATPDAPCVVQGGDHPEVGEMEATHRYTLTSLGVAALVVAWRGVQA